MEQVQAHAAPLFTENELYVPGLRCSISASTWVFGDAWGDTGPFLAERDITTTGLEQELMRSGRSPSR